METKINYAYSNNIMNHNNADYVKEIISWHTIMAIHHGTPKNMA